MTSAPNRQLIFVWSRINGVVRVHFPDGTVYSPGGQR